jgi:V/A-type H+-transporting ATPase subunit C
VIGGITAYASLSARVRALAGYLISREQWETLLASPDLPSFVDALGRLPYAHDRSLSGGMSLGELELFFSETVAREYEKFIAMTRGEVHALLREMWRRFELDNLKAILRHLAEERPVPVEDLIVPLTNSELPLDELSQTVDLQSAASLLSDTIYGPPVAVALPRYESENTLFPVEVALDLNYWRRVWKAVGKLRGRDAKWAKLLLGNRLDALNITWAFRYRIYYDLSEEEIINYTLPYGHRSDDRVLRAIAAGTGLHDVIVTVWGSDVPELADLAEGEIRDALQAMEVALARLECRLALRPFGGDPFHIGLLLGYLLRKECEAHDLTTAAESKAEDQARDKIEPYLVSFRA